MREHRNPTTRHDLEKLITWKVSQLENHYLPLSTGLTTVRSLAQYIQKTIRMGIRTLGHSGARKLDEIAPPENFESIAARLIPSLPEILEEMFQALAVESVYSICQILEAMRVDVMLLDGRCEHFLQRRDDHCVVHSGSTIQGMRDQQLLQYNSFLDTQNRLDRDMSKDIISTLASIQSYMKQTQDDLRIEVDGLLRQELDIRLMDEEAVRQVVRSRLQLAFARRDPRMMDKETFVKVLLEVRSLIRQEYAFMLISKLEQLDACVVTLTNNQQ